MKNNIPDELIKKYLAGNCSEAERKLVDEWYASFDEATDFINDLPEVAQNQMKDQLFMQINDGINSAEKDAIHSAEAKIFRISKKNAFKKVTYHASRIAAGLAIAIGLGFMGYNYFSKRSMPVAVATKNIFSNQEKAVKKITLPDGSKVWLQENSSLVISGNFGKAKRRVTLTGEAFFEVVKDKTRPFEIKTGEVTTRVLGTSFNIKAYEIGATVEVAVITGQVSVLKTETINATAAESLQNAEVILLPNQKATYIKSTRDLIKNKVSTENRRLVWAKSSFSFENTPIRLVIKKLNERFDTTIKLENEDINNCTIYGDFTNQNLPEILEVICKSIEAEYRLYKEDIIISGAGCPLNKPLP